MGFDGFCLYCSGPGSGPERWESEALKVFCYHKLAPGIALLDHGTWAISGVSMLTVLLKHYCVLSGHINILRVLDLSLFIISHHRPVGTHLLGFFYRA